MKKNIIDDRNGFEYELKGDYYYPTGRRIIDGVLTPAEIPEDDEPDTECLIGVWAQRHLRYIRQHKKLYFCQLWHPVLFKKRIKEPKKQKSMQIGRENILGAIRRFMEIKTYIIHQCDKNVTGLSPKSHFHIF